MKTHTHMFCGTECPQPVYHYPKQVRVYENVTYTEHQTEEGTQRLYYADMTEYEPMEYISYLETKLAQERADNDELLIDLDERVTAMEGE